MCLRVGAKVKVMDRGRTPLSLATEHGHTAVVELLLETEEVDDDSNRGDDRTPLSFAAAHACGGSGQAITSDWSGRCGLKGRRPMDAVILGCELWKRGRGEVIT
jgi:hypothetical protein